MTTERCKQCDRQLEYGQRKFCSKVCLNRFDNDRKTKIRRKNLTCGYCGISIEDIKHKKTFCSRRCAEQNFYQSKRSENNLTKYGLSEEEHLEILIKQDHRCAICRKPETAKYKSGTVRLLSIDHCHETGKLRGLLCSKCNMGLGLFNDDWLLLENAIEYLGHWHSKHGSSKVQSIQESPTLN